MEAGSLLGYSTIVMARVAASVVAIDRHGGYRGSTWRRFRSNLERAGVASQVRPIRGEALMELPAIIADLAFIDLTGEYELTHQAMLVCRSPLVAVHDATRSGCQGVDQAIQALGWPVVDSVDTLVVLRSEVGRR